MIGNLKSFQGEALYQDFGSPFSEKVADSLGCAEKNQLKTAGRLIQMLITRISKGASVSEILALMTKRAKIPASMADTILQLTITASSIISLPDLELDVRDVLGFVTDLQMKNSLEDALTKANRNDGTEFCQQQLYEMSNRNEI